MEAQSRNYAADEESKMKRRASSDEWTSSKKRVVSSASGSPIAANGAMDDEYRSASRNETIGDEPEKEDDIERFRKAAIFRRMRHYQREYGRAHERIQHLEGALKRANLERITAESCWSTTMDTIRKLTPRDALTQEASQIFKTVFPSRIFSSEDFKRTKPSSETKVHAAERAVQIFHKVAWQSNPPNADTMLYECQTLEQSNAFLTAELEQAYALLEDAQRDRVRYLADLRAAEGKLDRLQSRIVNPDLVLATESNTVAKVNGDVKTEIGSDDERIKREGRSLAPSPLPGITNECRHEDQDWEARLRIRDDRLMELEKENAILRDKLLLADSEADLLSENTIAKTPTYRVLLDHASKLEQLLTEEKRLLNNAREEVTVLRNVRTIWQADMQTNDAKEISELRFLLKKRDDDLNRIRQHREQLETQHKEMKAAYDSKRLSASKYKEVAESRGERIELLSSEVRRLKSRLAAASGNEDLLEFLQNDANIDANYIEDVKSRLNASQDELQSLRATLQDKDRGLIETANLRSKLQSATQQLEAYKSSGEGNLTDQLRAKDEELRVLRLKEAQSVQEMTELFSEMDRLSKAWETADKQAHAQAVSLEKWEDEKEKLSLAKQKSDHKYFKAMSESEAREAERKLAIRQLEKQAKQIEAMERHEKELTDLNESLNIELSQAKQTLVNLRHYSESTKSAYDGTKSSLNIELERIQLLRDQTQKRENDFGELNIQVVKLKDELCKVKKEAEKAVQKAKTMTKPMAPASEREAELQAEIDKFLKVLKCSCQTSYRNTVITKCMHTFCRDCVEARISLRQRKCPACNLAFSQSDVQQVFFQ